MKKILILILIIFFTGSIALKAQCPPNATAFALNYPLCTPSPGCGVLLTGWPEGVVVNIFTNIPLQIVTTVQIPGTYPGTKLGDAFVCVPCNVPLTFASTVPGATNGCVVVSTISVPVKLSGFSINKFSNDTYKLNWSTASENGTEKFEVERSFDGIDFTAVTILRSLGGNKPNHYSFTDNIINQPKIYYRLKTIEITGRESYSEILLIKNQSELSISVHPNSNGSLNINIPISQLPAFAQIYNSVGNSIYTTKITEANFTITKKLPAGVYGIKVTGATNSSITQKFITH